MPVVLLILQYTVNLSIKIWMNLIDHSLFFMLYLVVYGEILMCDHSVES